MVRIIVGIGLILFSYFLMAASIFLGALFKSFKIGIAIYILSWVPFLLGLILAGKEATNLIKNKIFFWKKRNRKDSASLKKTKLNQRQQHYSYWEEVLDERHWMPQKNFPSVDFSEKKLETELEFYTFPAAQKFAYEFIGDCANKKVLELGCGPGLNAIALAKKGAQVIGIDISLNRLKYAKKLVSIAKLTKNISLLQMNAYNLGFLSNCFDIIYSNAVLIHLHLDEILPEIMRVLKPGGKVVFVEPLKYHPLVNIYRYTLAPKFWKHNTKYFQDEDLNFLSAYFVNSSHREFYLTAFFSFFWQFCYKDLKKFKKSITRWQKVDEKLFSFLPSLRKLAWFTVFFGYKQNSPDFNENTKLR